MAHASDSHEQRAAEAHILAALAVVLDVRLEPKPMTLPGGARVEIDGVDSSGKIFVEVFAHQGRLRGGQFHKVARDALKLITVARGREGARLIVAFGDATAAACVTHKSWLAEALRTWGVEVIAVPLDSERRAELLAAQRRQEMVNRPTREDRRAARSTT